MGKKTKTKKVPSYSSNTKASARSVINKIETVYTYTMGGIYYR